jgi:hypothetical protein
MSIGVSMSDLEVKNNDLTRDDLSGFLYYDLYLKIMTNSKHPLVGSNFFDIRQVLDTHITSQRPNFSSISIDPLAVVWNQIHSRCDRFEGFVLLKYTEG